MSGARDRGMMGTEMYGARYPDPHYQYEQHSRDPYFLQTQAGRMGPSIREDYMPAMPPQPQTPPQAPMTPGAKESTHRFFGLGVGLASVFAEHVLSHPCIVLRRQCQVHHDSQWYHLTPVTLFQVVFNIHRHQSLTTLWKGIGSTAMVKGIAAASEAAISEFTPLPKEVTRHSSLRKITEHLLLKGLSILVTTPFYAASLVETVQSEIASERPAVLDCLREGVSRLAGWTTSQTTRLLPVWKLAPPVVIYGLLHYIVSRLAQYTVLVSVKSEIIESKEQMAQSPTDQSMYETYYPELIATFTGNLCADTLLFPLETVLHRLLMQGTRTIIDNTDTGLDVMPIITRYEGMLDCVGTILQKEGIMGFYKGFGSLVLQYAIHMAILRMTRVILQRLSSDSAALAAQHRSIMQEQQRRMMATTATQMTPRPPSPRSQRHSVF